MSSPLGRPGFCSRCQIQSWPSLALDQTYGGLGSSSGRCGHGSGSPCPWKVPLFIWYDPSTEWAESIPTLSFMAREITSAPVSISSDHTSSPGSRSTPGHCWPEGRCLQGAVISILEYIPDSLGWTLRHSITTNIALPWAGGLAGHLQRFLPNWIILQLYQPVEDTLERQHLLE